MPTSTDPINTAQPLQPTLNNPSANSATATPAYNPSLDPNAPSDVVGASGTLPTDAAGNPAGTAAYGQVAAAQAAYPYLSNQNPYASGTDPVAFYEQQAQALINNTLVTTGQFPSPQLAAEALTTGAVGDVISAQTDPLAAGATTILPTADQKATPADNGPGGVGGEDVYHYTAQNWKDYWDNLGNALASPQGQGFQQFGIVPIMNIGWMQGVMSNSQPDQIKKWQNMLHHQGFLARPVDPSHDNFTPSGVWDDATTKAFIPYMIDLATPEALYASDPNRKRQANQFLAALQFDTNSLASKLSDPEGQKQVLSDWMATQPDNQSDGLKNWVERFGIDSVPKNIQSIAQGHTDEGLGGMLRDTLSSLAEMIGGMADLLVPGAAAHRLQGTPNVLTVGGAVDAITGHTPTSGGAGALNLLINEVGGQGNSMDDPRRVALGKMGLSESDQQLFAAAIAHAQKSSGFMPLDWYNQKKNQFVAGSSFFLGDAFGKGEFTNPFDPNSQSGRGITAHGGSAESTMQGLWPQFTHDHPTFTQWTGAAADMLDDPLNYIGPELRLARLGVDLSRIARGAKDVASIPLGELKASDLVTTRADAIQRALSPKKANVTSVAKLLAHPEVRDSPYLQAKVLNIHSSILNGEVVKQDLAKMYKAIQGEGDYTKILQEIQKVVPSSKLHTAEAVVDFHEMLKSLHPQSMRRMGEGGVQKFLALGSLNEHGPEVNFENAHEGADQMAQLMAASGVPPADITRLLDDFITSPQERRIYIKEAVAKKAIEGIEKQGGNLVDLFKHKNLQIMGRSWVHHFASDNRLAKINSQITSAYAPTLNRLTGDVGEASRTGDKGMQLAVEDRVKALQEGINAKRTEMDELKTRLAKKYGGDTSRVEADEQFQKFTAEHDHHVEVVAKEIEDLMALPTDTPSALWESQLNKGGLLPFSVYDVVSYLHGGYRTAEWLSSKSRVDAFYRIWKPITLMRPGTAMHFIGGDDTMRYVFKYATELNHIPTALRILASGTGRMMTSILSQVGVQGINKTGRLAQRVGRKAGLKPEMVEDPVSGKMMEKEFGLRNRVKDKLIDPGTVKFRGQTYDLRHNPILDELGQQPHLVQGALMADADHSHFLVYLPGQDGTVYEDWAYPKAFHETIAPAPSIQRLARAALAGKTPEQMVQEQADYFKSILRPGGQEIIRKYPTKARFLKETGLADDGTYEALTETSDSDAAHLVEKHAGAEQLAKTQVEYFLGTLAPHPEMQKWIVNGKIDWKQFHRLYHDPETRRLFPPVSSPRQTVFAWNKVLSYAQNGPRDALTDILEAGIPAVRGYAQRHMISINMKTIGKAHPDWDAQRVFEWATSEANRWSKKNLYQGQRTVMGRAVRGLSPFWGATANMNRFYLRMFRAHPWSFAPTMKGAAAIEQSGLPGQGEKFGNIQIRNPLSMLAFTGGDMLTWNPAHAFFYADTGLGSYVPGFGPGITTGLEYLAARNQDLANVISDIPGLRESIRTAAVSGGNHPLIPYLDTFATGLGLISPFHMTLDQVPVLGALLGGDQQVYDKKILAKTRQMMADAVAHPEKYPHGVTKEMVKTELGKEMLTDLAITSLTPTSASITDETAGRLAQAKQVAATQGFPAAIQQFPEVANILQYLDPATSLEQRNQIGVAHPEVVPYATSYYESQDPTKPADLSQFDLALQNGDYHLMGVDGEFIPKIQQNLEVNHGWDTINALSNQAKAYAAAHGITTTSSQYKDWYAAEIQPKVDDVVNNNPLFGGQFKKSEDRSLSGLEQNTKPLRSLMSWEVLPQNTAYESPTSTTWRRTLDLYQQVVAQYWENKANGSTQAEQQQLLDAFNAYIDQFKAGDPEFARQVGYFSTKNWDDLVAYEVERMNQLRRIGVYRQSGGTQ